MGGFRRWKESSLKERDDRSSRDEGTRRDEILRKEREGGVGGNGNLGDSKFVVAEKAGELPRDEEARRGDILRIERERDRGKWLLRE